MSLTISNKAHVSPAFVVALLASCMAALFLPNGVYLFICLLTIFLIILLLWRNGRPGGIVFAFLLQWVQVIAYVIWMDVADRDINYFSPHAATAILCACVGLLVMAVVF
jgi:hypothetical protein